MRLLQPDAATASRIDSHCKGRWGWISASQSFPCHRDRSREPYSCRCLRVSVGWSPSSLRLPVYQEDYNSSPKIKSRSLTVWGRCLLEGVSSAVSSFCNSVHACAVWRTALARNLLILLDRAACCSLVRLPSSD